LKGLGTLDLGHLTNYSASFIQVKIDQKFDLIPELQSVVETLDEPIVVVTYDQ
jgi:hypothetical protein